MRFDDDELRRFAKLKSERDRAVELLRDLVRNRTLANSAVYGSAKRFLASLDAAPSEETK